MRFRSRTVRYLIFGLMAIVLLPVIAWVLMSPGFPSDDLAAEAARRSAFQALGQSGAKISAFRTTVSSVPYEIYTILPEVIVNRVSYDRDCYSVELPADQVTPDNLTHLRAIDNLSGLKLIGPEIDADARASLVAFAKELPDVHIEVEADEQPTSDQADE